MPDALPAPEFTVADLGTVWQFTPHTDEARALLGRVGEPWQYLGSTLVLDHRPAAPFAAVLLAEGWQIAWAA